LGTIILGLLNSQDCRLRDFKAIMVNGYLNNVILWKELLRLDLSMVQKNVKISYKILQGDSDIVASTQTIIELVKRNGNPYLQYEIVANTGHMLEVDMMNHVIMTL